MKNVLLIGFVILLSSCQTIKYMSATVKLSYQYGIFDEVKIDNNHTIQTAIKKCSAWGYTDAEVFGGSISHCQAYTGYGNCIRRLVTTEYQCIGNAK